MTAKTPNDRVLLFEDLRPKGINYHPDTVRRMVRSGEFPPPIMLSARRRGWWKSAIDHWLASRPVRQVPARAA